MNVISSRPILPKAMRAASAEDPTNLPGIEEIDLAPLQMASSGDEEFVDMRFAFVQSFYNACSGDDHRSSFQLHIVRAFRLTNEALLHQFECRRGANLARLHRGASCLPARLDAEKIQIFVRNLSGETYCFEINVNDQICSVQTFIEDRDGTPRNQYRLVCGRQLEDDQTVAECDIRGGSTLLMLSRLHGGTLTMMLMESALEIFSHGVIEVGGVGADRRFERVMRAFEWAMEVQKQNREDLRDLNELRVGRMDMYQLVCGLLIACCMGMFCDNPLLEEDEPGHRQWILTPFLVSNISAIGLLFESLWLSLLCSTATHSDTVHQLLQNLRVSIPTEEEMKRLAAPTQPRPTHPDLRADHVRRYLEGQTEEAVVDAYARVTLIVGVNQMMQALSYYLIGVVSKHTPTGSLISVVGLQFLACCLLSLDVGQIKRTDIFLTVAAQVLPPLLSCIVVMHQSLSKLWNLVPILSFLLHVLWIVKVCRSVQPVEDPNGAWRPPIKFRNVCAIIEPDNPLEIDEKKLPWQVTRNFLLIIMMMWVGTIVWLCFWILSSFEHGHYTAEHNVGTPFVARGCPGSTVSTCIDMCPSGIFRACMVACQKRCGDEHIA